MNTDLIFQSPMTPQEEIASLVTMIRYGGTVWFEDLLRNKNIKGRTKYVDSFRSGGGHWNGQAWVTTTPGRTQQDKENTAMALLREQSLEAWANDFIRSHTLDYFNSAIESAKVKLQYIVKVSI